MLCLSRKRDEAIIITVGNERIRVLVTELRGDKCRLGVEASSAVVIDREEVDRAKQRERGQAA